MSVGEANDKRFSITAYSMKFQANQVSGVRERAEEGGGGQRSAFVRLADDIRAFLAAAGGRTEEERQQYSETLNRAVLGFSEDRERLLAVIQDELIRRRIVGGPPEDSNFETLAEAIFAEVIGLNVLELILKQKDDLEEIQVIGTQIYEVRDGTPVQSIYSFHSAKEVERLQQNLVLYNNDIINPRKRWAEVMLADGSRVTMTGFGFTAEPTLTIRFYRMKHYNLETLCRPEFATMNEPIRQIITAILQSYFNMIVIGATNTGKTNLLKAFIAEMPDHERIITIESRFELMLKRDFPNKNVVEFETNDDDVLHSGNQAFKLALRQSPKRICHAEIRDGDANVYVRACTRGHEGSITTVHANSLEDAPEAITDMCMLDSRGMDAVRLTKRIAQYVTQIGFEMDIVHGKRKLVRIGEFVNADGEIRVNDIVRFDYSSGQWIFPAKFSEAASRRIFRYAPEQHALLRCAGVVESC